MQQVLAFREVISLLNVNHCALLCDEIDELLVGVCVLDN